MSSRRLLSDPDSIRAWWALPFWLMLAAAGGCLGSRNGSGNADLLAGWGASELAQFVATTAAQREAGGHADAPAAHLAAEPRRLQRIGDLRNINDADIWRLSLGDAFRTALQHTAIVRDRNQFLSPGNSLLANPDAVPSAFDVPSQQSSGRGVDAARSAFDPQLATGAQWGSNALVQGNNFWTGNTPQSDIFVSDSGSIFARLDKPLATGAQLSLVHNWNYTLNNLPSRSFNSQFAGFLRGEFRQPLWAGRGREFTDIAGPQNYRGRNLGQGVVVARLNENISLVEFEAQLQRLLKQTEEQYWELWLAYQSYLSQAAARDSAKTIWDRVRGRAAAGLDGGEAADEAQAQENFFERQERADAALAEFFEAEGRLRRLLGLPAQGQRILWPQNEPVVAEHRFEWQSALAEALAARSELRRQKLRIRTLELHVQAAKSLAHPQLDLVSGIQLNGVGDDLFGAGSGPDTASALGSLFDEDEVGWNAGFEFSMPFGFRFERTRVRNLRLQLAKARAALAAQEVEISHEMAYAVRNLDRWYGSVQSTAQRRSAAERRLKAVQADYRAGRSPLDRLLRSQVALADAELAHYRSVAEYNKAIVEFVYRKGALLEESNIALDGDDEPPLERLPPP